VGATRNYQNSRTNCSVNLQLNYSFVTTVYIEGAEKVSVHLTITLQSSGAQ